jgi:two-component system, chemotaxis family, protein-glutamate methylesterase/glutaminase
VTTPEANLIRVLVVDDSAFNRRTISEILDSSGVARVVGVARDGEEGIKKAFDTRPDLITLDLEMPRMDGFTFLRIVMKSLPTPILVISARSEDKNVFKALELGAIDFLAKPANHIKTTDILKEEIITKLKVVHELKLRNVQRRLSRQPMGAIGLAPPPEPLASDARKADFVLLGASTGGPSAIQSVIGSLPGRFDAAILISQHMPAGFTKAFAERLDRNSQLRVKEAEDGDLVETGSVLVAPGGKNLLVEKKGDRAVARIEDKSDRYKYVPSVDALFVSGSAIFADRCLGVVLTGMGNDGSDGVRRVKAAGGQVIVESEKSCIVYGMPKEAIATQSVDEVLNLEDIPYALLKRCRTKE